MLVPCCRVFVVGGVLALLGAAPAAAIENLEGTYAAKLSCRGMAGGGKDKFKQETEISITQTNPENVRFALEGLASGTGFLLSDGATQGNGTLSGVSCALTSANYEGLSLQLDVKTRPGSDQASFSGSLHLFDLSGGAAHVCKFKAKRVDATPPNLLGCP